ncbi:spore germination protein [Bacillus sp. NPDC077027]|uniref:spore germination protein n=1 Tax=Bacillus sp. NPDC077027 TaxID=3390548 RepID=UPI003CFF93D1
MKTNKIYIQDISGQAIVNFGNVGRICPMSASKDVAGSGSANNSGNLTADQSVYSATFTKSVQINRGRCMNSSL